MPTQFLNGWIFSVQRIEKYHLVSLHKEKYKGDIEFDVKN